MARISLRAYQRDIEELIETHQFDQAIAHCRHILRFYPKDVNTYRLLGKAYLESQRYGDASDIFIRVLSTIPDDFVSHVGMSIIREDEGNLDEAIWHMQRAFETQPANSAIQAELRRLHGRREGIEPPKIRLTRGALARMYLKGELYSQALAELRAELHEDPKRSDLQVVLAQAYYLAGQRVDAAEACSTLLKSLPFCLEANTLLADILSHSERAEAAQVYLKRVQALDPYSAHITAVAPTPDKVAESAVLLEKLDWRPGSQAMDTIQQPEWASSLGVDIGSVTGPESVPDWLAIGETKETQSDSGSAKPFEDETSLSAEQTSATSDAVPDWMKDAGWTAAQEPGDQPDFLPLSESEDIEPDLAPGDLPEWLKTMAPAEDSEAPSPTATSEPLAMSSNEEAQAAALPWLEETPPGPTDSVAMWLENQEPPAGIDDELDLGSSDIESIPDWLQDLGEPTAADKTPANDQLPDIEPEEASEADLDEEGISNLGVAAALTTAAGLLDLEQGDEEPAQEQVSETVEELQPEEAMTEEMPDWLQELGSIEDEPMVGSIESEGLVETELSDLDEPLAAAEIPEWLQSLEPQAEEQSILTPDDKALREKTSLPEFEEEIEPATAPTSHEAESSDWVPEMEEMEMIQGAPADLVETSAPSESKSLEDDEAFAWLENLAAGQGAEEAMLLSPDERRETPPEWILSEAEEEHTREGQGKIVAGLTGAALIATAITDNTEDELDVNTSEEITGKSAVEPETPSLEEEYISPEAEEPLEGVQTDSEHIEREPAESGEMPSVPVPQITSEIESAEEMLFFPLETARSDEQPIILDEGPISEEDTKPRAVKTDMAGAVATIAVAASAIASVEEEKETISAPMEGVEEAMPGEPESIGDHPQLEETAELVDEAPMTHGDQAKPIAAGVVIPEEDEAFAWLESLAARQGAEEALLLAPEDRQETPPEWVVQEAAEAEEATSEDSVDETELPDWLQATSEGIPDTEPVAETDTSGTDWQEEPAKIVEETSEDEESISLAPELPNWLEGIEDEQTESGPASWDASEESLDIVEEIEEIPDKASETFLEAATAPAIDLNDAGLVDLERLPGVGFIRAQAILDYRQQHGPFQEVDELLLVDGITPEMLLEVKQQLRVGGEEETPAVELPMEDHEILLVQARNALVQGDIPLAISRYGILIEKKQMLPEVITDLNEALYRFPIDVSIWEALGDAQMHSGHLQDALNAYTKAEEYLH